MLKIYNNRLIINLEPNTIYKWSVASKCSSGVIGKYSSEKTFTSAPFICQDVINIVDPIVNSKEYKSRNVINANSPINDNLNVIFRSNTIFLKPGFKTQTSKFKAYVKPCVNNNESLVSNSEELLGYIGMENDLVLESNTIPLSNNTIVENTFTISPNPTADLVQINSTIGINEWFVSDINAKIVLSGNNKNTTALRVYLKTLPAGLYYFKFKDSSGIIYEKTIIKK